MTARFPVRLEASMHDGYETTRGSLLLRVRNPDDAASWLEFEARYAELIRRYCARRGLRAADIDDVSQMVWVDLARGMRNFAYDPARGRFRAYLGRVVRGAMSRHFSRHRLNAMALDSGVQAVLADEDDSADDQWQQEWVDHHYRLAMRTIEATFEPRSIGIFQRLIAGESAAAVARDLEMSTAAVNQAKHRIRTRMRELIAVQVREEDDPEAPKQP